MVDKEMRLIPVIPLPGSEPWEWGDSFGNVLERRFPGQDGGALAMAMAYNDAGPAADREIVRLVMTQQGERDAASWYWTVEFIDGSTWEATAWCDYTGWDCRSALTWKEVK